eukprot:Hpha_TRINITY_DN26907_c0_g1::TRINITY_DN26907_c0_g1_i1::g.24938::m.24938
MEPEDMSSDAAGEPPAVEPEDHGDNSEGEPPAEGAGTSREDVAKWSAGKWKTAMVSEGGGFAFDFAAPEAPAGDAAGEAPLKRRRSEGGEAAAKQKRTADEGVEEEGGAEEGGAEEPEMGAILKSAVFKEAAAAFCCPLPVWEMEKAWKAERPQWLKAAAKQRRASTRPGRTNR